MRSVAFIFSDKKSKVKNEKLMRWRLELAEFRYHISYKSGVDNVGADALSRIATSGSFPRIPKLLNLHCNLAHPGIMYANNTLSFSLEDIKTDNKTCEVCCVIKPRFAKSTNGKLISALKPFERLALDKIGPKPPSPGTSNCFLLTVADENTRFPFAFPLR